MKELETANHHSKAEWQVIPKIQRHKNGDVTVRLGFESDYDAARPEWWEKLPARLTEAGFELDPWFDGSDDALAPASFFTASVLIVARKIYRYSASMIKSVQHDVSLLGAFLNQHHAGETNRMARRVAA